MNRQFSSYFSQLIQLHLEPRLSVELRLLHFLVGFNILCQIIFLTLSKTFGSKTFWTLASICWDDISKSNEANIGLFVCMIVFFMNKTE